MNALDIPAHFLKISYDGARFPAHDIRGGANCQAFAYALLRYFGRHISDLRSSDLWEDTAETESVDELRPLDLVLFSPTSDPFGAHVGVFVGDGKVIHLSKRIGRPAVWTLEKFSSQPGYEVFIGAKRTLG